MKSSLIITTLLSLALVGPAAAQRSLFDQPIQNPPDGGAAPPAAAPATTPQPAPAREAAPADEAAEPKAAEPKAAASRRQAKPRKPRGPVPARSLAVFNGSPQTLVGLEVAQDGRGTKLRKALAPGKRTRLALPPFKSCEVSVSATFEGQGQGAPSQVDICKETSLNFRN